VALKTPELRRDAALPALAAPGVSSELLLTVPAVFFSGRRVVQAEWLAMLIAGVSTTPIRSRMRFVSLTALATGDIQIKSCLLGLLKLMACQMD
jgi:hypothetical protein